MDWLRSFLEHYRVAVIGERQNGQRYFIDVECPWSEQHGSPSGNTTSSAGYERGWGYSYKCFHSECTKEERGWQEFKQRVVAQNPEVPAYGDVLPQLPSECSHADIARYFIQHEGAAKNHILLYDLGQRAVFVGTRWTVSDAGDRLLLRDVGESCDHLRWDLPEPDNPARDYRAKLKSHQFRSAALKQIETLLPPINYGRIRLWFTSVRELRFWRKVDKRADGYRNQPKAEAKPSVDDAISAAPIHVQPSRPHWRERNRWIEGGCVGPDPWARRR